ncbi:hypothetical protein [Klebsiella grimontii]|uniref:hypothetical protein n=1 Tax=Klebsiella grimontii TaxID=2058152 RepID=UPI0012B828DB|nr:hypothetical protein [Klebsiella grimontii]
MTTDITELAQMKGQKVEGSYYLAECTDCGKMYPSNKLNGGEPLFSGDYGECYCPHCGADDAAIGDCGDTAATAWNYQQGRIDALVEALEKAQRNANLTEAERQAYLGLISKRDERIAELESRTVKLPDDAEHDIMAPVAAYLSEKFKWDGGAARWDGRKEYDVLADRVKYALRMVIRRAAGIKWEAE